MGMGIFTEPVKPARSYGGPRVRIHVPPAERVSKERNSNDFAGFSSCSGATRSATADATYLLAFTQKLPTPAPRNPTQSRCVVKSIRCGAGPGGMRWCWHLIYRRVQTPTTSTRSVVLSVREPARRLGLRRAAGPAQHPVASPARQPLRHRHRDTEWVARAAPPSHIIGQRGPLGARYLTSGFDVADASHGLTTIGEVPGQLRRKG